MTIQVILDRVYKEKLITTTLKKRTLKKLILDTCLKTPFLSGGTIYEQIDGVSMGASLGPVLANIIMTELEKTVVDKLIRSGRIKFYARYVDDTLLLVKSQRTSMGFSGNSTVTIRTWNSLWTNSRTVFHTSLTLKFTQTDCQYSAKKPTQRNSYITRASPNEPQGCMDPLLDEQSEKTVQSIEAIQRTSNHQKVRVVQRISKVDHKKSYERRSSTQKTHQR